MNARNNAARVAVQAAALPAESAVVWVPCLLIDAGPLPCGMTSSYYERVQGMHYDSPAQALAAAMCAADEHPKAIGISCVREVVEVYA